MTTNSLNRGMRTVALAALLATLSPGAALAADAPAQTPQQRVANLQQWLKASQMQLRAYEWIETTVVTKGGEEKSRQQQRAYYGADGKVQKIPLGADSGDGGRDGRLGRRVKEAAKEQMADYMQQAVALVHAYVPPDPARIQQAAAAGKVSVEIVEPGRRVRLVFKDYLKPGDQLATEIELPTNRLLGMNVQSYLDTPADAVLLDVDMGLLPDGTIYTAKTVLDAKAKDLNVTVENTGHRKVAP
jgi:hypothetical protein